MANHRELWADQSELSDSNEEHQQLEFPRSKSRKRRGGGGKDGAAHRDSPALRTGRGTDEKGVSGDSAGDADAFHWMSEGPEHGQGQVRDRTALTTRSGAPDHSGQVLGKVAVQPV